MLSVKSLQCKGRDLSSIVNEMRVWPLQGTVEEVCIVDMRESVARGI